MSKQAVGNVSYPVTPVTTVLLSIDCQYGFGAGSWEQVPHADAAVENFRAASRAWRQVGGAVVHVQTTVDGLSMTGFKVIVLAGAFVEQVRALQPAAG